MKSISFFVPGKPQPAGSKRAFPIRRGGVFTGRTVVTDANKNSKPWQAIVKAEAIEAVKGDMPYLSGAVRLRLVFSLERPKGHWNAYGLKKSAPLDPIVKPDVLKLARGVEDALTGILWKDDAQIVVEHLTKQYGQQGVLVEASEYIL